MAVANAGWMIGARLLNDALSLVLFGIIARGYGPAGLGIYSTYFAIATLLFDLVALGIDDYGVREYAVTSEQQRPALLQRLLRLQVAATAVCVLGLSAACLLAGMGWEAFVMMASLCTFQLCSALSRSLNVPALVQGSVALINLASVGSRLGVAMVALLAASVFDGGLVMALMGFPVFGLAYLLLVYQLERRHLPRGGLLRWTREDTRLLRTLVPFAMNHVMNSVVLRIPLVVLFFLLSASAAGLYSTAFKFMELGWAALSYFILAAYADLARATAQGPDRLADRADHLLRQVLMIGGLMAWGLYAIAPLLVVPLLGDKVAEARPLIAAMAPYLVLQSISLYAGRLMYVFGMQSLILWTQVLKAVLTIVLSVWAAGHYGILGTIAALTIAEMVVATAQYLAVVRRVPGPLLRRRLGSFLGVIVLAGLAAWGAFAGLENVLVSHAVLLLMFLAGCVATGILSRDTLRVRMRAGS